jgi:hypothetical protein
MATTITDLNTSRIFTSIGQAYPPPFSYCLLRVYVNWVKYNPLLYIRCFSVHVSNQKTYTNDYIVIPEDHKSDQVNPKKIARRKKDNKFRVHSF